MLVLSVPCMESTQYHLHIATPSHLPHTRLDKRHQDSPLSVDCQALRRIKVVQSMVVLKCKGKCGGSRNLLPSLYSLSK